MKHIADYLPRDSDQHWSFGCSQCRFGIVAAGDLTGITELHLERLVQALAKEIEFCDCLAGRCYRAFLLNRRQKLIEEARKDKRMHGDAARLTHPEIIWAQRRRTAANALDMPTVHLEPMP